MYVITTAIIRMLGYCAVRQSNCYEQELAGNDQAIDCFQLVMYQFFLFGILVIVEIK